LERLARDAELRLTLADGRDGGDRSRAPDRRIHALGGLPIGWNGETLREDGALERDHGPSGVEGASNLRRSAQHGRSKSRATGSPANIRSQVITFRQVEVSGPSRRGSRLRSLWVLYRQFGLTNVRSSR